MRFKNRGQKALAAPRTLFFREFWTLLSWRRSLQVAKLAQKNCQEKHEWKKKDYLNDYLPTPVNRARKTFSTQGRQLLYDDSLLLACTAQSDIISP